MINREKAVCFSGHRSERLPRTADRLETLRVALYEEIDKAVSDGYDTFIFGACHGFDLMCAEMVLLRQKVIKKDDPKFIRLIAAVPFEQQASKWNDYNRGLYFNTLSKCNEVITISTKYNVSCYHKRNRLMIDNSSKLICYYDGGSGGTKYTVDYALKSKKEIVNLYK